MNDITDSILDAVGILVDDAISDLQFNKTIRGKIAEIVDASIGRYKIQYQNSYFTAYSADSSASYAKGSDVYVEILSNDFEKNAIILGTVRRLGSNYISIIEKLDKYTEIGPEQSLNNDIIELCSYGGAQLIEIGNTLDEVAMKEAAAASDTLKVAMKIKTALPSEQRVGGGNYGLKIVAEYYDAAYVTQSNDNILEREYLFDINDMTGQPYKYITTTGQYTLFPIDAKNFIKIKSIAAFCQDFPVTETGHNSDIFLSDIKFQFLKALTEEELSSSSLKITTPLGSYFSSNSTSNKTLKANLKIKGKTVNYDYQQVDFYWFRQNPEITASDARFSSYGGNGWECLNNTGNTGFLASTYEYNLSINLCPSAETKFKCVAVFLDGGQSVSLSDTIIIKNKTNEIILSLSSSTGTTFAFNTGFTTLTLNGYFEFETENTVYCWTESANGGAANVLDETSNILNVNITTPAATLLTYQCGVYEGGTYIGAASINLINTNEALDYTLVIKDGQQIFKYDTYGISPASQSKAVADRMIIPALSFEIYDKQGNLIDIPDEDKIRKIKSFRWIWPTSTDGPWNDSKIKKQTMLETNSALTQITVADLANNRTTQKYALVNQPTFTYSIIDKYNPTYANTEDSYNQIKLEVEYPEGNFLTAYTNFTFTKEGELGTNGTKYIAQLELQDLYKEIFICDKKLYAVQSNSTNFVNLSGTNNNNINLNNLFKVHLWDGSNDIINSATVKWGLANSTRRANNISLLTINENNATISINMDGNAYSNIIQVIISYNDLKFYATYPIFYTTSIYNNKILYIDQGYREVMYENDGTRGRFNSLPFIPKWLSPFGEKSDVTAMSINDWKASWYENIGQGVKLVQNSFNQFLIEPPSYYIAESTGHYIHLVFEIDDENSVDTYLPIELYLNRYGMSAMNDWDGNSIQISEDGDYILAPQVGAGRKEEDNSFTGITIGEVFKDVNNKEIGMFGYYHGSRSLFLDAETGDAEFGIASEGQIKIRASDGQGTISDGHYHYNHNQPYDPTQSDTPQPDAGRGLKIKFTSTAKDSSDPNDEQGPYIKYGSGNFIVDANGHLTAQGGGFIAGWKITDNYLRSVDNNTTLYSETREDGERFNINNKFIVYADGRFSAANSKFTVASDGTIAATGGTIGGWTINTNNLTSDSNAITLTKDGYILGPVNNNSPFTINNTKRTWGITPGGVAYFTDVKIKNTPNKSSAKNTFEWQSATADSQGNYPTIFKLTDTGSEIGGWSISGNTLSSEGCTIKSGVSTSSSTNSVLNINDVFKVYGNGNISASGGSVGGCSISGSGISGGDWGLGTNGLTVDGVTVNTGSLNLISSISLRLEDTGYTKTLDVDLSGLSINAGGLSVSGTDSFGGSINASISGSVSLSGSASVSMPLYQIHKSGRTAEFTVLRTGEIIYREWEDQG